MPSWPLSTGFVRLLWLRALCVVAEGCADVNGSNATCVAAVLSDPRMSAIHGRDGLPRSLASVYGCVVTLFLRGKIRGEANHCKRYVKGLDPYEHGLTPSRTGAVLLKRGIFDLRLIVSRTSAPDWDRHCSRYVWICPDGFLYALKPRSPFVYVFTPDLEIHMTFGSGIISDAWSLCANAHEIVVADINVQAILVFSRLDGAFIRRYGDGVKFSAVCYLSDERHVAATQLDSDCVSVFATDGACVRTFHTGRIKSNAGLACSSFDELFICDGYSVEIFEARGWHLQSVVPAPAVSPKFGPVIAILNDRVFFLCSYTWFAVNFETGEGRWEYKYDELK